MSRLTKYQEQMMRRPDETPSNFNDRRVQSDSAQIADTNRLTNYQEQMLRRPDETLSNFNDRLTNYQADQLRKSAEGYKKGGKISADWHGFKNSKTGKNNHGF